MNRKIMIGCVIGFIIALVISGMVITFGYQRWKGRVLSSFNLTRLQYNDRLITSRDDLSKLPVPAPQIIKQEDLRILVERITSLKFPECESVREPGELKCDDLKFRRDFGLCLSRVEYEVNRIGETRDREMVPELIEIAKKRKYPYRFLQGKTCEESRRGYLLQICRMRFLAIYVLGEIKDQRAVKPLVALLDEPAPSFEHADDLEESCAGPLGGVLGFTCAVAAEALAKIGVSPKDQGLMPELLQALEEIEDEPLREYNATLYEQARAGCKVEAASIFGDKALEEMVEKFRYRGTSESQKEALLASIAKIRDPKAINRLKELLHHPEWDPEMHGLQRNLSSAAAAALAGMSLPELIPEYIFMLNTEDNGYGCEALGRIKDPSTVRYLVDFLKSNQGVSLENEMRIGAAGRALGDMGPIAVEAVPELEESLKTCNASCGYVALALGEVGGDSVVPSLLQFVQQNPKIGGDDAVKALGDIGTDSAVKALKEIISGKDHVIPEQGQDNYSILQNAAVRTLWEVRGSQEKDYICGLKGTFNTFFCNYISK